MKMFKILTKHHASHARAKEIAESRELEIRAIEGIMVIYDPSGLYITSINSQKPVIFF